MAGMHGQAEAHSWALPPARRLAFAILLAFYSGGLYQGWRALAIPRNALPAAEARQLNASLSPAALAATPLQPALCSSPIRADCILLPAGPGLGSWALDDLRIIAEQHMQPALSQLRPARVGSGLLLHPPPLPTQHLRWDAQRGAHVLSAAAAAVWGSQIRELAWSAGPAHADPGRGPPPAQALLLEPPPAHQPLLLEVDGSGGTEAGMVLADGSLLLLLNPAAANGSGGGAEPSRHAALAASVLAWLLQPLADEDAEAAAQDRPDEVAAQLRRRLAAGCAGEAAEALARFVGAAEAAPSQPVTASLAGRAAGVARLLHSFATQQQQQQQQQRQGSSAGEQQGDAAATDDPLAAAQAAWAAAHQLLADPGTGARQAFPPEHAMAVLLPLALPVTLVLLQAAGREAAAYRSRRSARRQRTSAQQ